MRSIIFILLVLCSNSYANNLREREALSQQATLDESLKQGYKRHLKGRQNGTPNNQIHNSENTSTEIVDVFEPDTNETDAPANLFTGSEPDFPFDLYTGTESTGPQERKDRSSWPECKGMRVDSCQELIRNSIVEDVEFQLLLPTDIVTMDYVWERVRIYHDESSPVPIVVEPVPCRG